MNIRYLKTTLLAISLTLGFSCRSGKSQLHVQGEGEAQSALKVFSNEFGELAEYAKNQTLRITVESADERYGRTRSWSNTAFVIDDKHLITSAHTLNYFVEKDANGKVYYPDPELNITLTDENGWWLMKLRVKTEELIKNQNPHLSFLVAMTEDELATDVPISYANKDVGILTLKNASFSDILGEPVHKFPLELAPPDPGSKLFAMGSGKGMRDYPHLHVTSFLADENFGLKAITKDKLILYIRKLTFVEIPTFPGDSGGPVLAAGADGKLKLIGIITAGSHQPGRLQDAITPFIHPNVRALLEFHDIEYQNSLCL